MSGIKAFPCLGVTIFSLLFLNGCIPNVGRTNARLTDGWSFGAGGEGEIFTKGHGTADTASNQKYRGAAQFNLQKGWTKDNGGFALQLKLPIGTAIPSLDLYYQFPSTGPTYLGIGGEIGQYSSVYLAYSYYFNDHVFVTLTPRTHYSLIAVNGKNGKTPDKLSRLVVNPQLSLGWRGQSGFEIAAFGGYNYFPGLGIDLHPDTCIMSCDTFDKTKSDLHNHDFYFGGMLTF